MTPYFFIILTALACIMAAVAFLPFSKDKSDGRTKLFIGAALSLIPIIAKMTFSIFPLLEARLMPVDFYTVKGISPHQAAYALKRKLGQLDRSEKPVIVVPELKDLHDLPKPFLAGVKFSFRTNHMVCVMETTQDNLVVGDPISVGPKKWSWDNFRMMWSGIVIVLQNNNTF